MNNETRVFRTIWPQNTWVDETQIRQWYEDAVASYEDIQLGLDDPTEQAKALDSCGIITLGVQKDDKGLPQ